MQGATKTRTELTPSPKRLKADTVYQLRHRHDDRRVEVTIEVPVAEQIVADGRIRVPALVRVDVARPVDAEWKVSIEVVEAKHGQEQPLRRSFL